MSDTITFSNSALSAALDLVGKVRPWQRADRTPGGIRIVASGVLATITSVDLETTIEVDVPMDMPGEATLYAPFAAFSGLTKKAKFGAMIGLSATEFGTVFMSGRLRSTLPCSENSLLPPRPRPEGEVQTISAATLRAGLLAALPATAESDANRPYLGGVFLHDVGGHAQFAAQDGNRIHAAASDGGGLHTPALIPHRAAQLIASILPEDGTADIIVGPRGVMVAAGDVRVTAGLLNATFPPIAERMAVPTGRELHAHADTLLAEIGLVMTVANPRDRDFRLDLGATCEASAFRVADDGPSMGAVQLQAEFHGAPFAIGFQFRLVRDALALFTGERIVWRMNGPDDATVMMSPSRPGVEALVSPFMLTANHLRHVA